MRVMVAGATGFVGTRLCVALDEAGHEVRAMTRRPQEYRGAGIACGADVHEPDTLRTALAGCDAAYYLVHSLDEADFEQRDARAARAFAEAAGEAGLRRIVYLGGLGDDADDLSAHLRSRREVEQFLASTGIPVTTLRAGVIVGHGGISWELTRQLVEHLPAMITPKWVQTKAQPIAIRDVVRYLLGVLEAPEAAGRAFDIGGPEVLEYGDMLRRVAALQGRRMLVVPVPVLTPALSSRWLALVTDIDRTTGRALIDSMSNEVVVRDDAIRRIVAFEPMPYDDMVLQALQERAQERGGVRAWTRRRCVVAGTLVAGTGLLGRSLAAPPGSRDFYGLTTAVAATWLAGGLGSGPLHLGPPRGAGDVPARPLVTPVATGVAAFGVFYGFALVARRVPVLDKAISSVLDYADEGSTLLVMLTTLANGAAEEVFFRGAVYAALEGQHSLALSTAAYTATTVATRNPALVLAAGVMGTLFAVQRKASGGIQSPLLTHLTWSALMLRFLPPLFGKNAGGKGHAVGH